MRSPENNSESYLKNAEKYFTVPGDMLMDVLSVLINNDILYQIKTVDLDDYSILLYLSQKGQTGDYTKAIENIQEILSDYKNYSDLLR